MPPQGHRLCSSVREGLGLGKGHRGVGLGPSRCFLRSQEQQGSHGCGRYLIFFSREKGFTWLAWGQAQDLYLSPCEGNVSKYLHSKNWLYFLLLPLALGITQQALTMQMALEPPSFLEREQEEAIP